MSRMSKTIFSLVCVAIITVSAVVIVNRLTSNVKLDITQEKLYTLSDGTKAILGRLNQPVTIKLYFAKTATTKALDEIKGYNDYFYFVKALLEEYASYSDNVNLEIVDPRPFSEEEEEALRYGLKRFPVTQEEGFFFGMVARTEFGATKAIEFFAPDRQNLIEYDISYLLDTLTTRQKSKIGVLSSLPVMGEELSPYMMQMMQQTGQRPQQPWVITKHLGQKYELEKVDPETDSISGIDMLLVIHPKDLAEQTLFAIDQYVLNGGRAIFMVDPFCVNDVPDAQMQMYGQTAGSQSSSINTLLNKWGVNVPEGDYVGDKALALQIQAGNRPEKLIGYLAFNNNDGCFDKDNVISSALSEVRMIFGGVVEATDGIDDISFSPIIHTTSEGNVWRPATPIVLQRLVPEQLLRQFTPGSKPRTVAALVNGKFKSAFPDGIVVEQSSESESEDEQSDGNKALTGIAESVGQSAIAVFADVDFIGDNFAYNMTPFGASPIADNAALLMNTIDNLLGSDELIAIRSRGNFKRPFTLIDEIEAAADERTEEQIAAIQSEISGFEQQLSSMISEAKGQGQLVIDAAKFDEARKAIELKILESKKKLRNVQLSRREDLEALCNRLIMYNTVAAPAVILAIAIFLSFQRASKRRSYMAKKAL